MPSPFISDSEAPVILTINGGSSSIKFAAFSAADTPRPLLRGEITQIGLPGTTFKAKNSDGTVIESRQLVESSPKFAAQQLIAFLQAHLAQHINAIGHRIVHGGVHLLDHQLITPEIIAELKRTQPLDLAHLPSEISLIELFRDAFPGVPQIACFDTAFHRDLPRVAQLLPIPLHYFEAGVRRFGFHGLSYSFLMEELARVAGPEAARGKVVLAHLGSGASMAAVSAGKCVDTTMAFTPTAGLVMGTRPGNLDPGLLVYLARTENLSLDQMDEFINARCGLIGLSQTTSDMRDLVSRRANDPRAADAVDVFCYQARKWIGALAASMGGLDTLVFSGGIGEHAPEIRAGICDGLAFLDLHIDAARNTAAEPVISTNASRVSIRIIKTDEEITIVRAVQKILSAPDSHAVGGGD